MKHARYLAKLIVSMLYRFDLIYQWIWWLYGLIPLTLKLLIHRIWWLLQFYSYVFTDKNDE